MFDGGSHRSFITSGAAKRAQLSVIRQDWLGISTFGQRSRDTCLRDVVEIKVSPVGGQKVIKIEAYVVPGISSILNGHVELARNEYPHLKDLWFSDVCKDQEELEVLLGGSPMSQLLCRQSWVGSIIEEQRKTGVIEKVVELEKTTKVHYLPHQAVVRKEATTTKVV